MLRQLAPAYIDTGKAKVIYRHFAFIGNESQWAANAAECAGEQNKFWAYADYLFEHQAGENRGAFARDNLKRFAVELKLDSAAFNACFDSNKYDAVVKQETSAGQQRGVRATPSFFIQGQFIEGLLSPEQIAAYINAASR